jgi:hypothetical protein
MWQYYVVWHEEYLIYRLDDQCIATSKRLVNNPSMRQTIDRQNVERMNLECTHIISLKRRGKLVPWGLGLIIIWRCRYSDLLVYPKSRLRICPPIFTDSFQLAVSHYHQASESVWKSVGYHGDCHSAAGFITHISVLLLIIAHLGFCSRYSYSILLPTWDSARGTGSNSEPP